jgi:hypothetical protein
MRNDAQLMATLESGELARRRDQRDLHFGC